MADLPLTLEINEHSHGVVERHARIGTVQLVEINTVSTKTLETRLTGGAQMRWQPVRPPLARAWPCQAALGCNDQPLG